MRTRIGFSAASFKINRWFRRQHIVLFNIGFGYGCAGLGVATRSGTPQHLNTLLSALGDNPRLSLNIRPKLNTHTRGFLE